MTTTLTPQQLREQSIRMSGIAKPVPIEDVFSANFAKQIVRNEELLFSIMMIQNALELGQPEIALAQCKKALGR